MGKVGGGRTVCSFYEELDAILGSRAASQPQVVLENETGSTVRPDIGGTCIVVTITFCDCSQCFQNVAEIDDADASAPPSPLHETSQENNHSGCESDFNGKF